ncbi:hypothetical protein CSUI_002259, partial [Cystoisospora suis]
GKIVEEDDNDPSFFSFQIEKDELQGFGILECLLCRCVFSSFEVVLFSIVWSTRQQRSTRWRARNKRKAYDENEVFCLSLTRCLS